MGNADNPINGAIFQTQVMEWFENNRKGEYFLEEKILIGVDKKKKEHKFDIVEKSLKIAIECKRYTWTIVGNVPSAKMAFINEAVLYLSLLPETYEKYVVMLYSYNEKRQETLAEYYYRMNEHLLGDVKIAEYNPDNDEMRIIS